MACVHFAFCDIRSEWAAKLTFNFTVAVPPNAYPPTALSIVPKNDYGNRTLEMTVSVPGVPFTSSDDTICFGTLDTHPKLSVRSRRCLDRRAVHSKDAEEYTGHILAVATPDAGVVRTPLADEPEWRLVRPLTEDVLRPSVSGVYEVTFSTLTQIGVENGRQKSGAFAVFLRSPPVIVHQGIVSVPKRNLMAGEVSAWNED